MVGDCQRERENHGGHAHAELSDLKIRSGELCVALCCIMYFSAAPTVPPPNYDPAGCGRDLHMDIRRTGANAPHSGALKGNPFLRPAPSGKRYRSPMHGRSDPPPRYEPSGSGRDMFHCPASSNPLIQRQNRANASPFRDGSGAPVRKCVYLEDPDAPPSASDLSRRRAARRLRELQRQRSQVLSRPKSRRAKFNSTLRTKHTIFSNQRMLNCFALGMPVQ